MLKNTSSWMRRSVCACAVVGVSLSSAFAQGWYKVLANRDLKCVAVAEEVHWGWQGLIPVPNVWKTIGVEFRSNFYPEPMLRYRCEHADGDRYDCKIVAESPSTNRYLLRGMYGPITLASGESDAGNKVCTRIFEKAQFWILDTLTNDRLR